MSLGMSYRYNLMDGKEKVVPLSLLLDDGHNNRDHHHHRHHDDDDKRSPTVVEHAHALVIELLDGSWKLVEQRRLKAAELAKREAAKEKERAELAAARQRQAEAVAEFRFRQEQAAAAQKIQAAERHAKFQAMAGELAVTKDPKLERELRKQQVAGQENEQAELLKTQRAEKQARRAAAQLARRRAAAIANDGQQAQQQQTLADKDTGATSSARAHDSETGYGVSSSSADQPLPVRQGTRMCIIASASSVIMHHDYMATSS